MTNTGLIVLVVALFILLIIIINLWYRSWTKSKQFQKALELSQKKVTYLQEQVNHCRTQNKAILGALVGSADSPVDLLTEAQRILYQIEKVNSIQTVGETIDFLYMLIRSMANNANLHPIASYHQVVQYDPDLHIADHITTIGSRVLVVETGWRMGDEIIKKALVTLAQE